MTSSNIKPLKIVDIFNRRENEFYRIDIALNIIDKFTTNYNNIGIKVMQ